MFTPSAGIRVYLALGNTDDGSKINPDLISKHSLCVTCKKNDAGEKEEILCVLTRYDQKGEKNFECDAYEPKFK